MKKEKLVRRTFTLEKKVLENIVFLAKLENISVSSFVNKILKKAIESDRGLNYKKSLIFRINISYFRKDQDI